MRDLVNTPRVKETRQKLGDVWHLCLWVRCGAVWILAEAQECL